MGTQAAHAVKLAATLTNPQVSFKEKVMTVGLVGVNLAAPDGG